MGTEVVAAGEVVVAAGEVVVAAGEVVVAAGEVVVAAGEVVVVVVAGGVYKPTWRVTVLPCVTGVPGSGWVAMTMPFFAGLVVAWGTIAEMRLSAFSWFCACTSPSPIKLRGIVLCGWPLDTYRVTVVPHCSEVPAGGEV